jgi:Tfp pilus assembly major pilin PilA
VQSAVKKRTELIELLIMFGLTCVLALMGKLYARSESEKKVVEAKDLKYLE